MYQLVRKQTIARDINTVFAFFENPENLASITPSSVGFRILTPQPIEMKNGAVLDYTIAVLGLPLRWTTLITSYDPPYSFADIALKGPYSYWHHRHRFVSTSAGTEMTDEVHYSLPFGWLGRILHSLWVKRQLNRIFNFRAQVIAELIELQGPTEAPHVTKNLNKIGQAHG